MTTTMTETGISAEEMARLTPMVEAATNPEDTLALIASDDASEWLLLKIGDCIIDNKDLFRMFRWGGMVEVFEAVLASPHFTAEVGEQWWKIDWSLPRIAARMFANDKAISREALKFALSDRFGDTDVALRLKALKLPDVTADVVNAIATDWRVTVLREVAKHSLLNEEAGTPLLSHSDAKVRANITRHPWVSEESLYLLRDDPKVEVSRAAKRAMKSRGLAETDEMDAAMEDEVSLFFLAASDDENTTVRIGSSPNATEEAYRAVAASGGRGAEAVAANIHAPSSLLEEMSFHEAENYKWNSSLRHLLAGNPNNTLAGITALINSARWEAETIAPALTHADITAELVDECCTLYHSRARINAIKTGLMPAERVEYLMKHETRQNVLTALLTYASSKMTDDHVRIAFVRGNAKVRKLAVEVIEARGGQVEQLTEPTN